MACEIVFTNSEGKIGFNINGKYYEYRIDTGHLLKVLRMAEHSPFKALNFVKEVSKNGTNSKRDQTNV